jgi:phosphoribosyl-ATP pyrophosphohydrolase
MTPAGDIVTRLAALIEERNSSRPAGSYTTELLQGGHPVLAAKLVEEAYEVVAASAEEDVAAVQHEAADLVYHLLVLLTAAGVGWSDVERELAERFGVSGLDEKAQRPPG